MNLQQIKTSVLLEELIDRISVQLIEDETPVDDVFTFLGDEELDGLMALLLGQRNRSKRRFLDYLSYKNIG
jgi:hypothetical protein